MVKLAPVRLGLVVTVLALAWSFVACAPEIEDGRFSCISSDDECPSGFMCQLDQRCHEQSLDTCGDCGDLNQDGDINDADSLFSAQLLTQDTNFRPACIVESGDVDGRGAFDPPDNQALSWMIAQGVPDCSAHFSFLDERRSCGAPCNDRPPRDVNGNALVDIGDLDLMFAWPCERVNEANAAERCRTQNPCAIRALDLATDGKLTVLDAVLWVRNVCPVDVCPIMTDQPELGICSNYEGIRNCVLQNCL